MLNLQSFFADCAWDQIHFIESGRPFELRCELQTGNYEIMQKNGRNAQCFDVDGFPYGVQVDAEKACCLNGDCEGDFCAGIPTCWNYVT